jgi:hypothetical protein
METEMFSCQTYEDLTEERLHKELETSPLVREGDP